MTLAMPDSITPADLPPKYGQYLGYVDGKWPTVDDLRAAFPGAHIVGLTVTAATLNADGIDCEPGNPDAASAASWVADKLHVSSGRPIIYASVIGSPGYGIPDVISELDLLGIAPGRVRLLAAHYGWKNDANHADPANEHICGPDTCKASGLPMDGTQWTDQFRTATGAAIDMSALRDDFFGSAPPPLTWTETLVQQLPTVQEGDTGEGVRTAQAALVARHYAPAIDGIFGPITRDYVRHAQQSAHIAVDGIVGQQTWPVLLGIA